jgi:hypothetical protein
MKHVFTDCWWIRGRARNGQLSDGGRSCGPHLADEASTPEQADDIPWLVFNHGARSWERAAADMLEKAYHVRKVLLVVDAYTEQLHVQKLVN